MNALAAETVEIGGGDPAQTAETEVIGALLVGGDEEDVGAGFHEGGGKSSGNRARSRSRQAAIRSWQSES